MEKEQTCGVCGALLPLPPEVNCRFVTCPYPPLSTGVAAISGMSGKKFELFVRDRLAERGYANIETTSATGDMGADLIVRQNGKVIVIQCKRYAGAVGLKAVQEVLGAKSFYQADEAWVITDSTFTGAARRLARSANVRLKMLVLRRGKHRTPGS